MAEASCEFMPVGAFLLNKRKETKWNKLISRWIEEEQIQEESEIWILMLKYDDLFIF